MGVVVRKIKESDLSSIMKWRMDEDITRYMNTNPKLTLEGQKKWLASINENEDVQYFMIVIDEEDAGVISLSGLLREDKKLGWAYYVGEKRLRSMKTALALEMNLYDYAFDCLKKEAVVGDVFSLNKGVIQLHLLCGCEIVEEKKNHVEKEGITYDVTFLQMTRKRWEQLRGSKKYEKISFCEAGYNE
ncbi:GNAT family N-acetyltransferase [Lachnospiraceae bacterium OttesenSCG-928-D06]|nr:GNAT family N-acetyltransferase [Lachnospiraceae bacterium OttesenSCG-928-D06]